MAPLSAVSLRAYRRARSLRLRAGIARAFGPLFLVFSRADAWTGSHLFVRRIRTSPDGRCRTGADRLRVSRLLFPCGLFSGSRKPLGGLWRRNLSAAFMRGESQV